MFVCMAAVDARRAVQFVLRMAVISVRRGLQSVNAGRRVPGASFARAYSDFGADFE
jgi:hypothetical protein